MITALGESGSEQNANAFVYWIKFRCKSKVWAIPRARVGSFLQLIPAPLGLGKLELENGQQVTGFICEPAGIQGAEDITALGGWLARSG